MTWDNTIIISRLDTRYLLLLLRLFPRPNGGRTGAFPMVGMIYVLMFMTMFMFVFMFVIVAMVVMFVMVDMVVSVMSRLKPGK